MKARKEGKQPATYHGVFSTHPENDERLSVVLSNPTGGPAISDAVGNGIIRDDDSAAARGLFGAARDWLRARGMTSVRGPANPSLNYECGLLIEGFDTPPFFMMTHNRPWYGRLVEESGFGKIEDMYAFWGQASMLDTIDPKLATMIQGVKDLKP